MAKNKRRKKASASQSQKLIKAQQKKEFYRKIQQILCACECPDLLDNLTKHNKELLFELRITPVKVIAGNRDIKAIDLKTFATGIKERLNGESYTLANKEYPVTANDLLTVGVTLYAFLVNNAEDFPEIFNPLVKRIKPLKETLENEQGLWKLEKGFAGIMCMINSDFSRQLYYTKTVKFDIPGVIDKKEYVELYKYIPERRRVRIDGVYRTVFQVGWYFENKYYPSVIQTCKIKSDVPIPETRLNVYIQSHALIRLSERLNEKNNGVLQVDIFASIYKAKSFRYNSNTFYIDYYFSDQKAGYLVGEIIDGIVVIQTFLFLTHSSTPEGERLKELTGLNKLDMKYLNIDKLKVFQESDIKDNPVLKQLFIDAGCGSLFEIRKDEFNFINQQLADTLLNYLEDKRKDYNSISELQEDMQAQAI